MQIFKQAAGRFLLDFIGLCAARCGIIWCWGLGCFGKTLLVERIKRFRHGSFPCQIERYSLAFVRQKDLLYHFRCIMMNVQWASLRAN